MNRSSHRPRPVLAAFIAATGAACRLRLTNAKTANPGPRLTKGHTPLRPKGLVTGFSLACLLHLAGSLPAYAVQDTISRYEYDAQGNLTKAVSPLNTTTNPVATEYAYNAVDNLTGIVQAFPTPGFPQQPMILLDYDGQDQLTQVTDPKNNLTTYTMTGLGDNPASQSPDTGITGKTYDEAGNLKTVTFANATQTRYSYDALNRLTRMDFYAGNPLVVSGTPSLFTYDGNTASNPGNLGKVTRIDDEAGYTKYNYDRFGRLVYIGQFISGGQTSWIQEVSYSYGTSGASKGKRVTMMYPSANRLVYGYDAAGRIATINYNPGNANGVGTNTGVTIPLLTNIKYTPDGQFLSGTFGNSTTAVPNVLSRSYDLDGRISQYPLGQSQNKGLVRTLTYDPASRVTAMSHTGSGINAFAPANFNITYAYDNLDRLTSFTGPSGSVTYTYDANGNRTSKGADTYTVDAFSNKLFKTSPTAVNRTYDAMGNLKADGAYAYTYSARNRLSQVQGSNGITTYRYNAWGERVLKTGKGAVNDSVTQYLYDEAGHLIGEYDFYGRAVQETIYLGDMPIAVITQNYTVDTANAIRVDNTDSAKVTVAGTWPAETAIPAYTGSNYQTHAAGAGTDSFTWRLTLPNTGRYWFQADYNTDSTRATNATYTVTGTDGVTTRVLSQRSSTPADTAATLGWKINHTAGSVATVVLAQSTTGTVSADSIVAFPLSFSNELSYIYADHLNTPRVITRAADNVIRWRWDKIDPFGVLLPDTNPNGLVGSGAVFNYNPRFPGQVYDSETKLNYNYHRSYDPATGSYTTSDPIGLAGGWNTYAYVNGDPVNLVDPDGLNPLKKICDFIPACKAAAAAALKKITDACKKVLGKADDAPKSPPNPYGKKGGPQHQDKIKERINDLKNEGHEHVGGGNLPEERIPTPGGEKSYRSPDITTRAPDGSTYRENVGRTNANGNPIPRETRALDDIESATGQRPGYTPYDR